MFEGHTKTKFESFPNAHGDGPTWYRVTTDNIHDGTLINVFHTRDKNLAIEIYGYTKRHYGEA